MSASSRNIHTIRIIKLVQRASALGCIALSISTLSACAVVVPAPRAYVSVPVPVVRPVVWWEPYEHHHHYWRR